MVAWEVEPRAMHGAPGPWPLVKLEAEGEMGRERDHRRAIGTNMLDVRPLASYV